MKTKILLTTLSAFILSTQSFAITERFPFFSDVAPDHYKFSAITELLHNGVINGYADGSFQPDKSVSRSESLKILMEGSHINSKTPSTNPFADVPKNEWFAKYVYTAQQKQIIKGDGKTGLFYPLRTVNKAEAIKMILEINNVSVARLKNGEQWYDPYFTKAIEKKIIRDTKNAEYNLSRGDLAGLMYLYSLNKNNITLPPLIDSEKLQKEYKKGMLELSWNIDNFSQFKIIAQQKSRLNTLITSGNEILIPVEFWKNFTKGDVYITLEGKINGKYEILSTIKIPVYKRFASFIDTDIAGDNISWEYENNISVRLSNTNNIENAKGYVLNTHEELFEKQVDQLENTISLSFTPNKKDYYIIEITNNDGLAKAIIPITPKGYYPILPNNLDLLLSGNGNNDSVITEINRFRKEYNRKKLLPSQALSSLAQVRARDMKEMNYFSHYNNKGKTAEDMRSDFSIASSVTENIAQDSRGIMYATLGLQYSPTHRNILLSDEISFLGIGIAEQENGGHILVELFQKTPLSSDDIKLGNNRIYQYIEKKYGNATQSNTLESIAKIWSKRMAENNNALTDFGNGDNWKAILDTYNITQTTAIFTISHENPEKIIEFLENNPKNLSSVFQGKNKYGLSVSLSDEGLVYLSVIVSE